MKNNKGTIVSFNLGLFGSTGTMMSEIGRCAKKSGYDYICAVPYYDDLTESKDVYLINRKWERKINSYLTIVTGADGVFARRSTCRLVKWLDKVKPDMIHLHNIHFSFLNYKLLFGYLSKKRIPVIWTLHDCWTFTGHCPHFINENCEKWKTGCFKCPRFSEYPKSLFDNSSYMWKKKKQYFSTLPYAYIITPSQWLANLVGESFLCEYPVEVINNGINLSVFKPTESDFREKYNINEKRIVLGVSYGWSNKKGLDVFIELSKRLNENYKIVLIGTDDSVEERMPKEIISIPVVKNREELAGIYTAADIFVNPSREDTFPTVNIEALACGTPVITFRTGGSPEIVDESCGRVVENGDIDSLIYEIITLTNNKICTAESCISKASSYNQSEKFEEYVGLYDRIKYTRD